MNKTARGVFYNRRVSKHVASKKPFLSLYAVLLQTPAPEPTPLKIRKKQTFFETFSISIVVEVVHVLNVDTTTTTSEINTQFFNQNHRLWISEFEFWRARLRDG